jgi:hypothetical protein
MVEEGKKNGRKRTKKMIRVQEDSKIVRGEER